MNLPIRLRLTLWYSALLGSALLLFAATVYLLMADTLVSNLDASLRQRITQVQTTVDITSGHLNLPSGGDQVDAPFIPAVLVTSSGRLVSGPVPLDVQRWIGNHASSLSPQFHAESVGDLRLATAPIHGGGHTVGHVLVWQSLKSVGEARRSLLLVMGAAGPALLLVAGLGGLALARRALSPVAHITQTASSISASDLQGRVPVGSARDELSELATTFNAMIDRLGAGVQRERQFTGDASHELRSPLAVIRAETALALERPRDSGEYQRALTVIDEQAGTIEELISALLLLARLETFHSLHLEDVFLARLVETAVGQCRPSLERTTVSLDCELPSDVMVTAAAPLLIRAIRNVLDNGIKASPSGGIVRIRAYRDSSRAVLVVGDDGPGIALDEQDRIFDPFYQVSAARTPGESHGLGLAICQRIVRAHGGEVLVASTPGHGASFSIILPLADDGR